MLISLFLLGSALFALALVLSACASDAPGGEATNSEPQVEQAESGAQDSDAKVDEGSEVETETAAPATSGAWFTSSAEISFEDIAEGIEQGAAYGDPRTTEHGSFMRFQPGALVPNHSYSRALRGIVVLGEISNPTPDVSPASSVQSPGGYFSWPAQGEHVTECVDDTECHIFVIQDGPFELLLEGESATPITAGADKVAGAIVDEAVFTAADDVEYTELIPGVSQGPAYGDPTSTAHGSFMRFAPGATVPSHFYTNDLHGVVIEGRVANPTDGEPASEAAQGRGSSYYLPAGAIHETSCVSDVACLFFIYQDGPFELRFPE